MIESSGQMWTEKLPLDLWAWSLASIWEAYKEFRSYHSHPYNKENVEQTKNQ